jgi:hypothetical protein
MGEPHYTGPVPREVATSGADLSPNLRNLQGDFPGLDMDDPDVLDVFNQLGNLIKVQGEEKTEGYMEPGDLDYTIEATRIPVDKDASVLQRKYYRASAIYPTEVRGAVEEARQRNAEEPSSTVAEKLLLDPGLHLALRELGAQQKRIIVRLEN